MPSLRGTTLAEDQALSFSFQVTARSQARKADIGFAGLTLEVIETRTKNNSANEESQPDDHGRSATE